METVSPENTLTAVNQASEAIISKGRLDHNFPDLRTTFSGKQRKREKWKNLFVYLFFHCRCT